MKVYFRADGNTQTGLGHLYRSCALAQMIKDEFECVFVTRFVTEHLRTEIGSAASQLIVLDESDRHFDEFLDLLTGDEIVVLDNYFFDASYQKKIKDKGAKLVCVDDRKSITYYCDVIINHVIGISAEDLSALPYTKFCLGTDFALLRPAFIESMKHAYPMPEDKTILIAMGGTDYNNHSLAVAELLLSGSDFDVVVLIGDAYLHASSLEELKTEYPGRINVYRNLDENKIIALLKQSSIVICPPSSFSYEVCAVGRPLIVGSFAPGQMEIAGQLAKYNLAIDCGALKCLTKDILMNALKQANAFASHCISQQKHYFRGQQPENIIHAFKNLIS